LTEPFPSGYEIVQQVGPYVLKIRVSVYVVTMVQPDWKLGDIFPIKKVLDLFTGGKVVPVMTTEMEVFDAEGNSVAAAVVMRKRGKEMFKDDKLFWNELQPLLS
jgi:hypothetical protein